MHHSPCDQKPVPTPPRPQRYALLGEDGRRLSLATGGESFVCLNDSGSGTAAAGKSVGQACGAAEGEHRHGPALVLGMGADAGQALAQGPLRGCADVLWLECPVFVAGMEAQSAGWRQGIPAGWRSLNAEVRGDENDESELPRDLAAQMAHAAQGRRVYWHTQNMRLFPSFWGPVLGAVQAALLGVGQAHSTPRQDAGFWTQGQPRTVLLPGGEADLLHRELTQAFADEGCSVYALNAGQSAAGDAEFSLHSALRAQLQADRPALFFSVNGRGLDAQGVDFALLRACRVPVVLWLVDNPWHILSAWRQGWWREVHLFVTDHSFIPALRQAGASSVHHLPLAVAQHMAEHGQRIASQSGATQAAIPDALVHFVGRASFPARDKFFAAARVPEATMDEARTRLNAAPLPDFHWWARQLGVPLWPGYEVRAAGLGAECCASLRRARWLDAALSLGVAVHGDTDGWRALLPHAAAGIFHPAVDYYGALPEVYARAPYSLNVTSLLLPAGLTQRHFDVWAAGGFLLSDNTAGLDIFPAELTREIALAGPQNTPEAVNRLERDPLLRRHLQRAWQAHLDAAHTYVHRVRRVLEIVGH